MIREIHMNLLNDEVIETEDLLSILSDREKQIIKNYYYNDLSYEQIGKIFGISRQRIEQIVRTCLRRMRRKALGIKIWTS